jgi:hypothetical protein
MIKELSDKKRVVVAGDASIDWLIKPSSDQQPLSMACIPGGCMLTAEMIRHIEGCSVEAPVFEEKSSLQNAAFRRCVYRIDNYKGTIRVKNSEGVMPEAVAPTFPALSTDAELFIIDARDYSALVTPEGLTWLRNVKNSLTDASKSGSRFKPHVVLVVGNSFFSAGVPVDIFDLFVNIDRHLTVVCEIDDLRKSEIFISRSLSWERTARDLAEAFEKNARLSVLRNAYRVIVRIDCDGAFIAENSENISYTLIYDPLGIEGLYNDKVSGRMFGHTSILLAWIARQHFDSALTFTDAIRNSLGAMRVVIDSGFDKKNYAFPFDKMFTLHKTTFAVLGIPQQPKPDWSILDDLDKKLDSHGLEMLAESIAKYGVEKAIYSQSIVIPVGIVGGIKSVDCAETENLRAIYNLVKGYIEDVSNKKPLSIAVFGAPGSGKSFGVKQIIEELIGKDDKGKDKSKFIELNISQIISTDSLSAAFHEVRDTNLAGLMPVLFLDEFDSSVDGQPLFWLKNFLAPMQDGAFRENDVTHPIGRAIFVFAGGTSISYDAFLSQGTPAADGKTSPESLELQQMFKHAKGPDFVSRLRGYINVLGPNRVPRLPGETLESLGEESDPLYIVRRALFINTVLKSDAKKLVGKDGELNIDPGILRALLKTPRYKHGVRSIAALVQMCRLTYAYKFERSCLPGPEQLTIHIDPDEFLKLCNEDNDEGFIESWARVLHQKYYDDQTTRGWKYDVKKDAARKTNPLLTGFDKIEDFFKDSNRDCARSIPAKLNMMGFNFRKAIGRTSEFQFPKEILDKYLEPIAEFEHNRWYRFYILNGWKYAPERNDEKKEHNLLVPYHKLTKEEQFKDLSTITIIPKVLAETGFEIYRM